MVIICQFLWIAVSFPLGGQALGEGNTETRARHKAPSSGASYKMAVELKKGLSVTGSLEAGLLQAAKQRKSILVVFLGVSNLKSNLEYATLTEPKLRGALNAYVIVALYSDSVPPDLFDKKTSSKERKAEGEANYKFEGYVFKTRQVPFYAIVAPAGNNEFTIISTHDKTASDDPGSFLKFLKK